MMVMVVKPMSGSSPPRPVNPPSAPDTTTAPCVARSCHGCRPALPEPVLPRSGAAGCLSPSTATSKARLIALSATPAQLELQPGCEAQAAHAEPRRLPDRAAHQVGQAHQHAAPGLQLLQHALQLAARAGTQADRGQPGRR